MSVISTISLGLRRGGGRLCKVCGSPGSTCGPDHMQYPPIDSPSEKRARARKAEPDEKAVKAPNKKVAPPEPTELGADSAASDEAPQSEPGRPRSQRRRRVSGK